METGFTLSHEMVLSPAKLVFDSFPAVLQILDSLVGIRIRGTEPLACGRGSRSCFFVEMLTKIKFVHGKEGSGSRSVSVQINDGSEFEGPTI
jgi:hypothetical protein